MPEAIESAGTIPSPTSDHKAIYLHVNWKQSQIKNQTIEIWDYQNGNYNAINNELNNLDWDSLLHDEDINQNYAMLTTKIIQITKQYIPVKIIRIRAKDKPWYNNELRNLKRKTLRIRKHAQKVQTEEAWSTYKHSRNKLNSLVRQTKKNYPDKVGQKLKNDISNPKAWWRTVNTIMKGEKTQSLPPLKTQALANLITDPIEKANIINDYFTSQTKLAEEHKPTPLLAYKTRQKLTSIELTLQEVSDVLTTLNKNKAQGPDNISPHLLKKCSKSLAYPLWKVMKKSLDTQKLPNEWKAANITPIHKKGDKALPENYRPIALTSVICKVLERIIFKHMYNFFNANNLLSRYQSGFIPGDSTTNQLVDFTNMIYESFEDKKSKLQTCSLAQIQT